MARCVPRSLAAFSAAWIFSFLLFAVPAWALKQPNNVTIPTTGSLQLLFNLRGEQINALADAADVPETFTPVCKLNFEVIYRGAAWKNSFGWYNITAGPPPLSDLHEFISCNDLPGTKKVLSILKDPAYKGGDIGFYQATGPCATLFSNKGIMYSEKKYNPDSNQLNPFIHLLIYNSTVTPKAFYFGWEDQFYGGDSDFDDLTMFVSGIACTGGGGKCSTGKLGACAEGTMACQSGMLACLPLTGPAAEVCDGVDNDCDGVVDQGKLCPGELMCDKGNCVPKCDSGEFKCPVNTVCDAKGLCVDPACLKVTCPANSKCDGGKCVAPCDGVVCPYGQLCLAGGCLDPCKKLKCDADDVCSMGACVAKCDCAGCKKGQTCKADGTCVPDACANVTCSAGTHCDGQGKCADDCAGAVCPKAQACVKGQCVPSPSSGQGGGGGAGGADYSSGAFMLGGGAGEPGNGGSSAAEEGGVPESHTPHAGCSCRVADGDPAGAAAALVLALVASRRRRASAASPSRR